MMQRISLIVSAIFCLLLIAGCNVGVAPGEIDGSFPDSGRADSGGGGEDAGHDAGTDTGFDVGVDGGEDAGDVGWIDASTDAGTDAGPPDSGPDSGPPDAGPPGKWVQIKKADPDAGYVGRESPAGTSHYGKLWFSGGIDKDSTTMDDVWSSTDGVKWDLVKANDGAGFPSRGMHCMVSHASKLWVIAGSYSQVVVASDVYSSVDGVSWTMVKPDDESSFPKRGYHGCASFNGRLWVIGGGTVDSSGNLPYLNDVWSSADGATWKLESNAPFSPRDLFAVAVFNGRLWVIGGATENGFDGEVWSSPDGVSWKLEKPNGTGFEPRMMHTAVVYGGYLWVLDGGQKYSTFGDVWTSWNGGDWELQITSDGSTPPKRSRAMSMALGDRVYLFGGV
ncbi:MAG: hypothetical protein WC889_18300, partial [Myxococcota bacterium]